MDNAFLIAARRSGSAKTGFYRPGERSDSGAPFEVSPTKCPAYTGPPSGRDPTADEKHGAWQLEEEYLAGRLGKNEEENGRLWNTAKWIDRHLRIATTPANATKPVNLLLEGWKEAISHANKEPEDELPVYGNGVEYEPLNIDKRDKNQLLLKLPDDYELARLVDYFNECDHLAKIDENKLASDADPLPVQIDSPGPIGRQESIKVVRMLMLGMRSLWQPVKAAIVDHSTMTAIGKTRTSNIAAVGRQRVIEGLRIAESIRKGLSRQDRVFSAWLNQVRAKQTIVNRPGFSVDDIIIGTLTILAAMPLPANDNYQFEDQVRRAA
jgi:hypothetical protein